MLKDTWWITLTRIDRYESWFAQYTYLQRDRYLSHLPLKKNSGHFTKDQTKKKLLIFLQFQKTLFVLFFFKDKNLLAKNVYCFLRKISYNLTNHNLLLTITINNFSDSDDNKIKFKKKLKRMQCRVDVPWCLTLWFLLQHDDSLYTGAPIVGIARWSVPRFGQGHLEVKW